MATGRIGVTPTLGVRWSKAPTGGTTSLSGLDDNSVSLVYSVGYEQVYRNGVLLSRTNDYTATTGNTITLIDATITGDIIEVFANELVPLTDAISKGQFTAKGALLSATAASTPGVLTVGSNDQVLTADSTTSTGLKWATPGGALALAQIAAGNMNSGFSATISSLSSYDTLVLYLTNIKFTTNDPLYVQINSVASSGNYFGASGYQKDNPTIGNMRYQGRNEINLTDDETTSNGAENTFLLTLTNCKATGFTTWQYASAFLNNSATISNAFGSGIYTSAAAVSNLKIVSANGFAFTGSGTYKIWGA